MKRSLLLAVLSVTCWVLVAGWSFGKKENPVQERFEATMNPPLSSNNRLTVAIREFSSDQEVQEIAKTFAEGGEGALEKAFGKVKKGEFRIGNEASMPLMMVTSSAEGSVRRLSLLGKAPTIYVQGFGGSMSTGHRGYPYTFIQLEVDEKGNGSGMLILYVNLTFDPQGRMSLKPMERQTFRLVNVHKL